MDIDGTSSGSSDSNPGHFSGFYSDMFFPPAAAAGLVGKRAADFDVYFGKEFCHQGNNSGKRSDVVGEKSEGVSDRGVEVGGKRGVYVGGDYGNKKVVEEFVDVRNKSNQLQQQPQGGFFISNNGKKQNMENEIQLNGVSGFGKKTISFSPDQVRPRNFVKCVALYNKLKRY